MVVMKTVYVAGRINDCKRIVDLAGDGQGLADGDAPAELTQQHDQTRAIANNVCALMHDDVDTMTAAGKQQAAHRIKAPRCVVCAAQSVLENADCPGGLVEEFVERLLIRSSPFELALDG